MAQKILWLTTDGNSVRDTVWGWGCEDSDLYGTLPTKLQNKPIGVTTPSPKFFFQYKYVLEAMKDGWKLLGIPEKSITMDGDESYTWWLVKD